MKDLIKSYFSVGCFSTFRQDGHTYSGDCADILKTLESLAPEEASNIKFSKVFDFKVSYNIMFADRNFIKLSNVDSRAVCNHTAAIASVNSAVEELPRFVAKFPFSG